MGTHSSTSCHQFRHMDSISWPWLCWHPDGHNMHVSKWLKSGL
jgi:hypothetical protein